MNMTVKILKLVLKYLPDDMDVIIPVVSEDDANYIYGFRHVRTAGVLHTMGELDALCINTADNGLDISTQLNNGHSDIICKKLLF